MASNRTPLVMAATNAREKLQASAQNIWSSIRSFDDSGDRRVSSGPSDDSPTKGAASASLERLESVIKVMFGSCTTGTTGIPRSNSHCHGSAATGDDEEDRYTSFGRHPSSRSMKSMETGPQPMQRQKDIGGHVYEQLFMDDQTRAVHVSELREMRQAPSPPSTSPNRCTGIPRPFSASNPTKAGHGTGAPPLTTKAVDVSTDSSFDDDISAISAHTLNEMARYHDYNSKTPSHTPPKALDQRTGSGCSFPPLSTQTRRSGGKTKRDQHTTAPPPPPTPRPVPPAVTPLVFSRGRSHASANSKGTRTSKTTQSSQDSEFASVWRRDERKYWDDVAREDEEKKSSYFAMSGTAKIRDKMRRRSRSRCGSYSTKHDLTITTASSSSYSNMSMISQFDRHPHDTYYHVMVSHKSELGEI